MPERRVGERWLEVFGRDAANPYASRNVSRSFFTRFTRGPYLRPILRYAQLPARARVIEVGCGSTRFTACLASLGYRATALDISPAMLGNARDLQRHAQAHFGRAEVALLQADLDAALPVADGCYDLVFNEGVVEHWLDDPQRLSVLREMARITRPGGVMAVLVPNGGHPWIEDWVRHNPALLAAPPMIRYTIERLRAELARAGLEQIASDGIYPWHSVDWGRPGRMRALLGSALTKTAPAPRALREKWGVSLIGLGRKP